MKLTKHGVSVPDNAIYYNDEDIVEEDDDFEGDWKIIDYDPLEELASQKEVTITVKKDIQKWLDRRNIQLDDLVENLLDNFYRSQKMIEKK